MASHSLKPTPKTILTKNASRTIASSVSSLSFTTANGTYVYNANQSFNSNRISSALTPIGVQQGSKLKVPFDAFGCGVSISADGNTLVSGSCKPWSEGSYVFTRTGTTWTKQGNQLRGSGGVGDGLQGQSVSMSADGNTFAVGAPQDNSNVGAVWVFVRNGNTWTQQGLKLVGSGGTTAKQGTSVALSADGNTLVVGGPSDLSEKGAVWVFKRTNGVWSQLGSKLLPNDATSNPLPKFGTAVAINANGNTIMVGGPLDSYLGYVWFFTLNSGSYVQQGTKITGTGYSTQPYLGTSVALSADGNTAAAGGPFDDRGTGGVWIFKRNNNVWSQEGNKLIGTGAVGKPYLGTSVSLSADGDLLLVGANLDDYGNNEMGASWVFGRTSGVWSQKGSKLVGTGTIGFSVGQGNNVALSADGTTGAVSGAKDDNTDGTNGAVWIFVP